MHPRDRWALAVAFLVLALLLLVILCTMPDVQGAEPRPSPRPVGHVHASQRYDRPVARLARQYRLQIHRPGVSLVTWTEVAGRRGLQLHRLHDGWASYTPRHTDVAASWSHARWRLLACHARLATRLHYRTVRGAERRIWILALVLEDKGTGQRLVLTLAHLPSAVDAGRSFQPRTPQRGRVWRAAVRGWARQLVQLQARWHPDLLLTVADWNVDLRQPAWRQLLLQRFPGQRLTWRTPLPPGGTQGRGRLIDATLTTGQGRAQLLPATSASDHRAYLERVRQAP